MADGPTFRRRRRGVPRGAIWAGGIVLALLVAFIAVLAIQDWNFARPRIASFASSILHREVRIDGNLSAKLLSSTPTVRVEKITVANPDWAHDEKAKDFASVERLVVALSLSQLFRGHLMFETLEIDNPHVAILTNEEGGNNFDFSGPIEEQKKNEKKEPPKWPGVREFSVRGGEIYVSDVVHKLTFTGKVEANEENLPLDQIPFRLRGDGTLNKKPFKLTFAGGPLANIRMDKPYEFDADVTADKTHAVAKGKFERPFDFARIDTALDVQGDNLAHLYYLTNLALPFTPPYKVSGQLKTTKEAVTVTGLQGVVGKSDIGGDVKVELKKRPKLTAQLKSKSLDLVDLSPAFGKGVAKDKEGNPKDSEAPKPEATAKLLPDYEFEFDRLRSMDAAVTLHADSVKTEKIPFTGVEFNIQLNDAVLRLDPVVFTLPLGKLSGVVDINAQKSPATTKLDLRMTNVKLDQFKSAKMPDAPLAGTLQARMQLTGTGNSVHDFAASADGKVTAVVPHGEIRQAFAELTGINIARGLGLLLAKDQQRSDIRCGVAGFEVKDGKADLAQMVFDTETVLIKGDGDINLNSEGLNLEIKGEPKKARVARLKTPIKLSGTLKKPSVGVDAGDTAKQVGIAAALGTLLAPVAAAIAFIDPGLAKDADCSALLAEAEKSVPQVKQKDIPHGTEKDAAPPKASGG